MAATHPPTTLTRFTSPLVLSFLFYPPQKVMAAAAGGPAGVHMELGGKSAMIVFDDIEDIDATVDWSVGFVAIASLWQPVR